MTETVAQFLIWAGAVLSQSGVPGDLRREARLLLAHAEGVTPETLFAYPERAVVEETLARSYIERRAAREPVSRILGRRSFWKHEFAIGPGVLDPRPDTETLVETVLRRVPDREAPLRLVDLGVGSGCILLSLLDEYPNARGVGVDIDRRALETARGNARALDLLDRAGFVLGDWLAPLDGAFDVIVSNPPYIETGVIGGLAPEVRNHDPRAALDGGGDGLDAYRAILAAAPDALKAGGLLACEVGHDQARSVGNLFENTGLAAVEFTADIGGIERIVSGIRPPPV